MCGRHLYNTPVGNITWTVSPQTTIFYQSTTRIFSTHEPSAPSPTAVSTIINSWLMGLADGQNFQANPVAESVITFAVEPPQQPTPPYLRLFEQRFRGIEVCFINNFHFRVIQLLIIVPQTTRIHLIYSTAPNPPSSCTLRAAGIFPLRKLKEHVFPVLHIVIRNAEHTIWNTCALNFRRGEIPPACGGTGSLSYRFMQPKPFLPLSGISQGAATSEVLGSVTSATGNMGILFLVTIINLAAFSLVSFTLSIGEL